MKENKPLGALMIDIQGTALNDDDIRRLRHSAVGGVILFRRNFISPKQISELIKQIKSLRNPELIIATDHEGGRVQRFIEGFTRLPAMRNLGKLLDKQGLQEALNAAEQTAWVLASELRAVGVDLSFTPVLDLDWGKCAVIGNRSLHADAKTVAQLAIALQNGLQKGGMAACGKHFPGHGAVSGDSHHTLPCDERSFNELNQNDILPFQEMIKHQLAAIMPAHVVYPQIDAQPAGFSNFWLKQILRQTMNFQGIVFSDDLTMEGAAGGGTIKERTAAALTAGCDVALVCNRPDLLDELLDDFPIIDNPQLATRWQQVRGKNSEYTPHHPDFQAAQAMVSALCGDNDLDTQVKVGEAC